MAKSVNEVRLLGYAGGEPEMTAFTDGGAVTNVTLATTRSWRTKGSDDWKEETTWHRLAFYGRLAEAVKDQVGKGDRVYASGRLNIRTVDSDGMKKTYVTVIADYFILLESKSGKVASGSRPRSNEEGLVDPLGLGTAIGDEEDDGLPF